MHRPRGRPALSEGPEGPERPIPQAWVPRVTNGAVATVLLLMLSPIVVTWGDRTTPQRIFLAFMAAFVSLFIVVCVTAALRPGALSRMAKRGRDRR